MTDSFVDKVAWIHLADRRILSTRSKGKAVYYIPGGKRERGESDLECLAREIREELSIELALETARFLGEFEAQADGKAAGVVVRMRCYECEFEGEPVPSAEIEEMVWLCYSGRARSSPVDGLVFDFLRAGGRL